MKKEKKIYRGGCPHCPGNEDVLDIKTILYNGFGGYHVEKNGKVFYVGKADGEWESFKTLQDIEKEAKKSPKSIWKVILNNPLRGATWKRDKNGKWILKETNLGFA